MEVGRQQSYPRPHFDQTCETFLLGATVVAVALTAIAALACVVLHNQGMIHLYALMNPRTQWTLVVLSTSILGTIFLGGSVAGFVARSRA